MSALRWSFVLPALLSATPLWAQTMHYPFPLPAQTKPLTSADQGIGSIGDSGGGESIPATRDPFNCFYNTPYTSDVVGAVLPIGSGNISAFNNASPQPACYSPASSAQKLTYKMYNLGDMGLLGQNKSLAQDIAQSLPLLFPTANGVLLDKVLVVQQTPEVIAQVDEFLKKLREMLSVGKDRQGREDAADSGTIRAAIKEAPGQGKWTIQGTRPNESSLATIDKTSSEERSKSATGPWSYANGKLTPEEEKLQRFWHDYYDSMGRYYRSLEHVDWVTYYKNHGYQINTGGLSAPAPPADSALPTPAQPALPPAGQIDVMPSPRQAPPPPEFDLFGGLRDSSGEALFKIYKLSDLGLTTGRAKQTTYQSGDDDKLVQWIVDILPRIDADNKVGPLYLPEKGLLVVFYTPDVIAQVDSFLKKAKETFAAVKENDVPINSKAPTGPIVAVHYFWNKQMTLVNQGSAGNKPLVGIQGRVYFFGPDFKYPFSAYEGAKLVVDMSYVRPDGKAQKNRYEFAKESLHALLRRDTLGWGYSIPLPWVEYQEGIKQVTIQASLLPECGDPIVGKPTSFVPIPPAEPIVSGAMSTAAVQEVPGPVGHKSDFPVAPPPPVAEEHGVFKVFKLNDLGYLSDADAAELGPWIVNSLVNSIPSANWDVAPVVLPNKRVLIVKGTTSVIGQVDDFLKSLKSALASSETSPSGPAAKPPTSFRRNAPKLDAATPSPVIPGNPSADELQPAPPFPSESKADGRGVDVLTSIPFADMSGHESDFSWVTGVLRSEKGEWFVDYFQDDDCGGKLLLKNLKPCDVQNGDLVCVTGRLTDTATRAYAVSTIHLIERPRR